MKTNPRAYTSQAGEFEAKFEQFLGSKTGDKVGFFGLKKHG
jgi:hypothetical protein